MTIEIGLLGLVEVLANLHGEGKEEEGRALKTMRYQAEPGNEEEKRRKKGGALKTGHSQAEPGNEGLAAGSGVEEAELAVEHFDSDGSVTAGLGGADGVAKDGFDLHGPSGLKV